MVPLNGLPNTAAPYCNKSISFRTAKIEAEFREKIGRAQLGGSLEIESVRAGLRKCALVHGISPEALEAFRSGLAAKGLMLEVAGSFQKGSGFVHKLKSVQQGPTVLRGVVARNRIDLDDFLCALNTSDDLGIGALLGYPECCGKFFQRVWKQGCVDPVWETAANTNGESVKIRETQRLNSSQPTKLVVLAANEDNSLLSSALRYIGLRLNSHFACSANCQASIQVAKGRLALARELKLEGLDDLIELLRLPYEWSCYQGKVTVWTPCFSVREASVGYSVRRVLRQEGWF